MGKARILGSHGVCGLLVRVLTASPWESSIDEM